MSEPLKKCRSTELTETCGMCGKAITDDEFVVNWGSCNECFDRGYEEYLKECPDPLPTMEPCPFDEQEKKNDV